jgi:hypothetical protein
MAVLATALPRVERVLAESGAGAVVRDADEAASFLRFWSSAGKQDLTKMRAAARAWADGLYRDGSPYDVLASELAALGAAKE